jgi:hypothetical protein
MNFLRIATLSGVFFVLGGALPAGAQTYGGGGALAGQVSSSGVAAFPGDGVRLSESALLHLGVAAEAGYDTNVFYDNTARTQSAVLTVTPFFDISNSLRQGESGGQSFVYHLGASLAYRQYLNNDPNVKAQTAFTPTVNAGIAANGAKVNFALNDTFTRIEEAPYGPSQNIIKRDHNTGVLQVGISPGGGRITTLIRYANHLDYFENIELRYGNNMAHLGTIDTSWKWLPKTALFLRLSGGYIHYLTPDATRSASVPVGAGLGIRGLITPKLSASIDLGYGTAFYLDKGTHVSGVGNVNAALALAYRLGYATSLGLGYSHGFRNSPIIGDYYNVDGVFLGVSQGIGARLVFTADGRYEWRRYQGVTRFMAPFERRDHVAGGQAKLDFFIQKWLYAGIGYNLTFNESNESAATARGVDYVKHQVLGRVGVTY